MKHMNLALTVGAVSISISIPVDEAAQPKLRIDEQPLPIPAPAVPEPEPQEDVAPEVKDTGYFWTDEEDALLRKLFEENFTHSGIAQRMGRSTQAVKFRCHKLGLKSQVRTDWPEDRVETMRTMLAEGATFRDVGKALGVSGQAVLKQAGKHGLRSLNTRGRRKKASKHAPEPEPAAASPRKWSLEEIARLRSLIDAGETMDAIVEAFPARTENAVRTKISDSGYPMPMRRERSLTDDEACTASSGLIRFAGYDCGNHHRWTDEDDDVIRDMAAEGSSDSQIAEALERVPRVVARRRRSLNVAAGGGRKADRITERPCIRCRGPFESEGKHHRMCDRCRHIPDNGMPVMSVAA